MGTSFLSATADWFTGSSFSFGMLTVCAVCFVILAANILRRKIRFLRRSMMPTAVIAGILGLVVKELIAVITRSMGLCIDTNGFQIFSREALESLVYHALPIGFIALCLREKDDYAYEFNKTQVKKQRVSALKSGSLIISTYLVQGIIGVTLTIALALVIQNLNPAAGLMLPLGFGQGPQQALATGGIWDDALNAYEGWGDGRATNFGITVAAFGFLWAAIPGVILINIIAKRKGLTLHTNECEKSGDHPNPPIEGPNEIPLSESIDKFSIQVCMVLGIYAVTIGIICVLDILLTISGVPFLKNLIPTIWGFAFMIAVGIALLAKVILRRLVKTKVMKRVYPNSYMMNRIGGVAFDLSITAALFLIDFRALGNLWIPILIITAAGGLASIFYLRFLCSKIYKDYQDEAFVAMYGMLTGTIANGMILLRELDRKFETPAADDLVSGSSTAIILALPLLLLIGPAPEAGRLWWTVLVLLAYFGVLSLFQWLSVTGKMRFRKQASCIQDGADSANRCGSSEDSSPKTSVAPQSNLQDTTQSDAENQQNQTE